MVSVCSLPPALSPGVPSVLIYTPVTGGVPRTSRSVPLPGTHGRPLLFPRRSARGHTVTDVNVSSSALPSLGTDVTVTWIGLLIKYIF